MPESPFRVQALKYASSLMPEKDPVGGSGSDPFFSKDAGLCGRLGGKQLQQHLLLQQGDSGRSKSSRRSSRSDGDTAAAAAAPKAVLPFTLNQHPETWVRSPHLRFLTTYLDKLIIHSGSSLKKALNLSLKALTKSMTA